jgi:hypothetical protein
MNFGDEGRVITWPCHLRYDLYIVFSIFWAKLFLFVSKNLTLVENYSIS